MLFKDFKKLVNEIDEEKFGDADVLVDTEAAQFTCHMVDPTGVYVEEDEIFECMGQKWVSISLSHDVKQHVADDDEEHRKAIRIYQNNIRDYLDYRKKQKRKSL